TNQFMRDGHYKRSLETGWGHIQGLRVPMLECQDCHHDVICRFSILEKYSRFWLDLDQDVLFSSGLGQSLRVISQRWSEQVGGNVGLRTIVFPDQPERTVHRADACERLSHLSQCGSTRWHLGHDPEPNRQDQAGQ